jgi:predicted DNA-binding protein
MNTVNVTISIPEETYNRLKRLAPKKEWGENHKQVFYTNIFMNGLESGEFLKAENRRLETILRLTRAMLKPGDRNKNEAIEDVARQIESMEDMTPARKATESASNGND